MSEQFDIRGLLQSWPYDPENDARVTRGVDGRPILQVRTPLGLEQYEMEGRPDGRRPYGKESAFEYQLERLASAKALGTADSFTISAAECTELFSEGTLFYYRYLHLFQIRDWQHTARDTERNLKLFDFVHRYAKRHEDKQHLEQWRPYILRMRALARTMLELENGNYTVALEILNDAIHRIEALPGVDEDAFRYERDRSLTSLRELVAQIEQNRPLSALERLERDLNKAVAAEEFERAAQLRDKIRELRREGGTT